MINRIVLVVVCLVLGAAVSVPSGGAFDIPKPSASIENIDIDSISFRDINLKFFVGINNPYPLTINLDSVRFKFLIDKNQLFETKSQKGFKIKANKKQVNEFLVNLKFADIERIVKNFGDSEYVDTQIEGEITLLVPKTGIAAIPDTVTFPFKLKKKIPAIKPEIKIANFKVQQPSLSDVTQAVQKSGKNVKPENALKMFGDVLSGKKNLQDIKPEDLDVKLTVSFDIELENKTRSKISFESLNYDFFVNADALVKGDTKDVVTKDNKLILKVLNQFSSRALGKAVLSAFSDKKGNFALKGYTFIKLPDAIKKDPLKLVFDESGNFSL
jgi:LEA14-like dessication related protein